MSTSAHHSRGICRRFLCLSLTLTGCGGSASPAPAPATPSASAIPVSGAAFVDLGRVLAPADFGQPSSSIIGDPTGVLLPDGRIRLLIYVENNGVWRAISTDAEGAVFRVEGACTLIPDALPFSIRTPRILSP